MVVLFYIISGLLIVSGLVLYLKPPFFLNKRHGLVCVIIGMLLIFTEAASVLSLRIVDGYWIYNTSINRNHHLFESHPYLVGRNIPNTTYELNGLRYSHNSLGYRGDELSAETKIRIVCIGGSTTYGVGVNDNETWPYYLQNKLGHNYEVVNMAVPGHSSTEHLISIITELDELNPDIILIHCGLNDLRCSHASSEGNIYSDFHAPSEFESLGLCPVNRLPLLGSIRIPVKLMQKVSWYPVCMAHKAEFDGEKKNTVDWELKDHYTSNLHKISKLLLDTAIDIIYIPQVGTEENFVNDNYEWWAPYLGEEAIMPSINAFNHEMKGVADKYGREYAFEVENFNWNSSHFADPTHLNSKGNKQMSGLIKPKILKLRK